MKNCHIQLDLSGTWCNDWPMLKITVNTIIYFEGAVQGDIIVAFDMPIQEINHLKIEHYGKFFGERSRWDTLSHDDRIIQDRAVKINQIRFDNIDIKKYLYHHWPMQTNQGSIYTDYLGHNGEITISFNDPVYDWIITKLVAPKEQNKPVFDLVVETSFGNLFDYSQDLKEIEEIELILTKHAHLID